MKDYALDLDAEWFLLILEAKRLGIQKDEVRKFLRHKGKSDNEHAII